MGHLSKHATIAAAPATVYAYIADVRNAPNYISAVQQITSGPRGPAATGQEFGARALFLGQQVSMTLRVDQLDPNRRVVLDIHANPDGVLTLTLTPVQGGSRTDVDVLLEVPSLAGFVLTATMGSMLNESLKRLAGALR